MKPERLTYIECTSYYGSREQEMAREIRRCWKEIARLRDLIKRSPSILYVDLVRAARECEGK